MARGLTSTAPIVEVAGLAKAYGTVKAVQGVDFSVAQGEVFALLGPNGAGKTTTIEILEGFRPRDHGTVEVLGVDPGDPHTGRWLRDRMGVVLQELAVEPFFTVRQVLTRNASYYLQPRPVDEVIHMVGLSEKADIRVKKLSGGQQRRLDVGLGVVGRPQLLVLDEPTTGLDPEGRRATWELIRQLAGEGTTVLLSSHYMDEVEALADHMAVMAAGKIVATGTPGSIGGRDLGAVTIRFRLQAELVRELPVAPSAVHGDEVQIVTTDDLAVLHRLTGWALERAVPLTGLTANRITLEDVYLRLTGTPLDTVEDRAHAGEAAR